MQNNGPVLDVGNVEDFQEHFSSTVLQQFLYALKKNLYKAKGLQCFYLLKHKWLILET